MIGEFLSAHFTQIMAVLAAVVWAIRLEARVTANNSEIKHLEKKIESTEKTRIEQRKEDMATIHATLVELRADVKALLMRDNK